MKKTEDPGDPEPKAALTVHTERDTPESDPTTQENTIIYRERLWPAWWVWLSAAIVAFGFGLITTRVSAVAALVVLIVALVVFGVALIVTSPQIVVQEHLLRAGKAQVPLVVVGDPQVLDATQMQHMLGPGANALAHLCIRGWVHTGVMLPLTDPNDPTPYWLLSSQRPDALAEAIRSTR